MNHLLLLIPVRNSFSDLTMSTHFLVGLCLWLSEKSRLVITINSCDLIGKNQGEEEADSLYSVNLRPRKFKVDRPEEMTGVEM